MLHLAALALAFAAPPLAGALAATALQRIDVRDVTLVKVNDGGTFREGARQRWTQYGANGRAFAQLEEVRRDGGAIYLRDRSRGVDTILDIRNREVRGTDPGSNRVRRFYSIIDIDDGGRGRDDWRDRRDSRPGSARAREVEVGPIWNQADAEQKCRQKAREIDGSWNGNWRTTVPGRMSVCAIENRIYDNSGRHDAIRDVEVGPIANQADAERKCRAEAARRNAQWTGQWYSMARISACQMRFR